MNKMPIVFVRETLRADIPFLLEVAKKQEFKTVNFPSTREGWERDLRRSETSFRVKPTDEGKLWLSVIAEPDLEQIPIGASSITARNGRPERPRFAYQVVRPIHGEHYLERVEDTVGCVEVGGMVVHPDVMKDREGKRKPGDLASIRVEGKEYTFRLSEKYGTTGSWARFLLAGIPPFSDFFGSKLCLSEFLPAYYRREDGIRTNAFYEAVCRPVLGVNFDEADEGDPNELMRLPEEVLISSLSPEARAVMEKPGPLVESAVHLLERVGFEYIDQIYPLDGGPNYTGSFAENPIVRGVQEYYFGGEKEAEGGWIHGIVGYYDMYRAEGTPCFVACTTPYHVGGGNRLWLPPQANEVLQLTARDRFFASPFPVKKAREAQLAQTA